MEYGGVVRDSSGKWLQGVFGGCTGGNPLLVEIIALKAGLYNGLGLWSEDGDL